MSMHRSRSPISLRVYPLHVYRSPAGVASAVLLPVLLLLFVAGCTPRAQASHEPFSEARFAELQQGGALILVDVAASWCGTCVIQSEILAEYQERNPRVRLHILQVDFDEQKQTVTALRAPSQSTLILFQGDREIWRTVAEMRRDVIFSALDRGVAAL